MAPSPPFLSPPSYPLPPPFVFHWFCFSLRFCFFGFPCWLFAFLVLFFVPLFFCFVSPILVVTRNLYLSTIQAGRTIVRNVNKCAGRLIRVYIMIKRDDKNNNKNHHNNSSNWRDGQIRKTITPIRYFQNIRKSNRALELYNVIFSILKRNSECAKTQYIPLTVIKHYLEYYPAGV